MARLDKTLFFRITVSRSQRFPNQSEHRRIGNLNSKERLPQYFDIIPSQDVFPIFTSSSANPLKAQPRKVTKPKPKGLTANPGLTFMYS